MGAKVQIDDAKGWRDYLKANDLVEYDAGVTNEPSWVDEKEYRRDLESDIKRFVNTPSEYISPDLRPIPMNENGSLSDGTEIDTDNISVSGAME